jgi:circadian clock protein KaiB
LQEILGLADSPHFLVPGYTATVERWLNPQTQQLQTIAEAHLAVQRYIPLLQVLFELDPTTDWHIAPWQEEHSNRGIIETYRPHFPQLWANHDLVARFDPKRSLKLNLEDRQSSAHNFPTDDSVIPEPRGYVLHLFVSSSDASAEQTLNSIHRLLEEGLNDLYTLKVIDVTKNPEQAAIDRITTTPTLVRVSPKPMRRIVGQLDDIQKILSIISIF